MQWLKNKEDGMLAFRLSPNNFMIEELIGESHILTSELPGG